MLWLARLRPVGRLRCSGMHETVDQGATSGSADAIRVIVVDDHDLFRKGLCRLLDDEGMRVLTDECNGEDAVRRSAELQPQVVVMDVSMPGISGIEATRQILAASPSTAVLMLTVCDADDAVLGAVLAGACGYLLKDAKLQEIVRGIRAAAAGQSPIAARVAGSLLVQLRRQRARTAHAEITPLSPREHDVLTLLVAGHDNSEIGRRLHLSAGTVKHHVSSTLGKLGVENRIQAAVLAVRLGLVDDEPGGESA